MLLQNQLDEITANTRRLVQEERLAASEQAIAELFATGIEESILPIVRRRLSLLYRMRSAGRTVRSEDLLAVGP